MVAVVDEDREQDEDIIAVRTNKMGLQLNIIEIEPF